ncbi:MAG: hypothetical protein J6Q54_05030, partial [Oscillospiraceae bacterium]|nr:hypothetical protein [Oscillospiraceae bacterium]
MGIKSSNTKACIAGVALIVIILDSKTAVTGASAGIQLCIKSIIPSLFPYMAAAGMMVSLGTARLLGRRVSGLT